MDKRIIKSLQDRMFTYEEEFKDFPYKTDPSAVFAHECTYYLEPLTNFIVPEIARRLQEEKSERVEHYLPYVLERYHDAVRKEVNRYKDGEDAFSKVAIKEILSYYNEKMIELKDSDKESRDDFIYSFVELYHETMSNIVRKSPRLALECLAQMRTPKLQLMFLKKQSIMSGLGDLIQKQLIKDDWSDWLPKFFAYPRTNTMEEYLVKWIGRDKLHIKYCKPMFGEDYDQIKIWLKSYEKDREKQNKKIAK